MSFPGGSQWLLRRRRWGFDPRVRKVPWRRKWQGTLAFLAWKIPWTEKHGGRYSPRGREGAPMEERQNSNDALIQSHVDPSSLNPSYIFTLKHTWSPCALCLFFYPSWTIGHWPFSLLPPFPPMASLGWEDSLEKTKKRLSNGIRGFSTDLWGFPAGASSK